MSEVKRKVGLEMLESARDGEFDTVVALLTKVLANPLKSDDEKFRSLRSTNAKIGQMLATRGVRALLIGAGWVEEGEFFRLPADSDRSHLEAALEGLQAEARRRENAASASRTAELVSRQAAADKENEERKRMKMQIADDAAARSEPGWKAQAAGVKGGRNITSCADIGAQGGGGG